MVHGYGFLQPARRGESAPHDRVAREALLSWQKGAPENGPLKLAKANTSATHRARRRESRGLEEAPQLTDLVHEHASRAKTCVP